MQKRITWRVAGKRRLDEPRRPATVAPHYDPEDVRVALDLDPRVPVLLCDARQLSSVKQVLITLVEHVLSGRGRARPAAAPAVTAPGS